ncbi:MAG: ribonuclease D [Micrococcales bacterium]|nr:ribonuclease D [Micrococcales bacterium]NBR61600.1 ribonuclease D [Actinomycetota bacterium]NBY43822.1 ribonuclease D [Micrococcales bacterium]
MTEELDAAPLPLLKPRKNYHIVQNDNDLNELLRNLDDVENRIALDAERASGFRYGQKAYLIQVAFENSDIYLVDPIASFNETLLEKLRDLVNSRTWIIHAATQDLECLREFGLVPRKILDTELAGRLCGLPKVSLGTMCEIFLNVRLAKEHSAVDWSTRPLPDSWLNYAALDVDVLFDLWECVEQELLKQGKLEIALEEFQNLTNQVQKPEKIDRWRSVTGIHEIKDVRQLTIIKSLWEAREHLAKQKDVAPGRLIPDSSLINAVKAAPKSKSELSELRSFSGRASRTYLDLWWDAYESGSTTTALVDLRQKTVGIPNHRNWANRFPEAHTRLIWSKKLLQEVSVELGIPLENLINPDALKHICFEPDGTTLKEIEDYLNRLGVRSWQINLVSGVLVEAFGKTELPEGEEPKV